MGGDALPWSVAAQVNEREMRMRCLELGDSILRERNEWRRRDAAAGHSWPLIIDPTHQQIADDLMAYVLTGEHREFFREHGAPPLAPHDGVR